MPKILVDILPAKGHFYGSLKLVQKLRGAGYNVVYLNMEPMAAEINKYGFQMCTHTSVIINPVLLNKTKFSFRLFTDKLFVGYKEINDQEKSNFRQFRDFCNKLSPDLVLLDEQNMLKAIYYELMGIPVLCFETKPEPIMSTNVPPFTSLYIPSNTLLGRLYCRWLWGIKISTNYFRLRKKQLNYFGQDDYSTALRVAKRNGQDFRGRIDLKRSYGIGLQGINRLILSPVDFDFPGVEKEHTFSLGPMVDLQREGEIDKARYASLLKRIQTFKGSEKGNVIYCSMGTVTAQFSKRVTAFLKKILHVARLNANDLFILSVGGSCKTDHLVPSPSNVHIFESVPQIDLLGYCDIMITHGGINSITECIFHGIPTLNYPLSQEWDPPGCAARAVYHNVGLMGKIKKDPARVISMKLSRIKSNYSDFQKNTLLMKEKFEKHNHSDRVVEIVENILKDSKHG